MAMARPVRGILAAAASLALFCTVDAASAGVVMRDTSLQRSGLALQPVQYGYGYRPYGYRPYRLLSQPPFLQQSFRPRRRQGAASHPSRLLHQAAIEVLIGSGEKVRALQPERLDQQHGLHIREPTDVGHRGEFGEGKLHDREALAFRR